MPHRRPPLDVIDPTGRDDLRADPSAIGTGADADPDPADVLARMRPPAPRSWRDRLDDLLSDLRGGPRPAAPVGLVVGGLAAVVLGLAAVVAWQLTAAPAAAPDAGLPLAAASTGDASTAASEPDPDGAAAGAGGAVAPSAGAAATTPAVAGAAGAGEVVVHVVGAVTQPGVQHLPVGARVTDAIAAAGGATPDADLARVNLAAPVADGTQIVVPRPGETVAPAPAVGLPSATGAPGVAEVPININTATAVELEELPGVGPATAAAIIAHRDETGPFASVDELIDVRGIGEVKLEQLRSRATV